MFPSDRTTSNISQITRLLVDPTNAVNVTKAHLLLRLEAEERQDWEGAAENYLLAQSRIRNRLIEETRAPRPSGDYRRE